MRNFAHHARRDRPRPNAHSVLALLTLVAMTVAVLLPSGGSARVAVASSSDDHRSPSGGSSDGDTPLGAARTERTVQGKAQRRRAEAPSPDRDAPAERAAEEPVSAATIDTVEEAQAAMELLGQQDLTGDDRKKKAEGAKAKKKARADRAQREKRAERAEKKAAAPQQAAPPAFPEGPSRLFARHDAMHLFTPSADPVRIGFHEASYANAVGMIPLGRALANDNMGKYHLPPLTPTRQQYMVLASRGRPHSATSAADIVMRPGEPVRSVVTGMVVEVRPYLLYGRYPDNMIRIRSAEDNGKIVTMLHVTGPRVHVGQQVLAGDTIVANSATSFPFLSQIDYYLGGKPHPHVHVEVKRG